MDRLEQIKKQRARQQRRSGVVVGKHGRIVIPAEVRKQLEIEEGDRLVLLVKDGQLVLTPRIDAINRLREAFEKIPPEVSLVDQLHDERRREFLKEERDLRQSLLEPGDVNEGTLSDGVDH